MSAVEQIFERIEQRLERIERRIQGGGARVVFDAAGLREMGIPRDRAYALLREHGSRTGPNGKRVITRAALDRVLGGPSQ